jgi:hypothetical protein
MKEGSKDNGEPLAGMFDKIIGHVSGVIILYTNAAVIP